MDTIIFCFLVLGIYFFPTIIAVTRSQENFVSIFILNLLLGWTGLGWVIALIWAFIK